MDPVATASLLDAGVAMRLFHKDDNRYGNSTAASDLLIGGSDDSLVEWVRMMKVWSRAFFDLPDVVRTGKPAGGVDLRFSSGADDIADQGLGLFRHATRLADELAAGVTSLPDGVMVDIGGGFGADSLALFRRFPGLRVHIWELSDVVPQAQQVVAERGMADRISVAARDYTTEEFASGLAAILMSNARTLMRPDPLLLVFDESAGAAAEHAIFDRYRASADQAGRASGAVTLFVSHRFSAVRLADRIVVLREGRVVECGSHDELMKNDGLYAELFAMQTQVST